LRKLGELLVNKTLQPENLSMKGQVREKLAKVNGEAHPFRPREGVRWETRLENGSPNRRRQPFVSKGDLAFSRDDDGGDGGGGGGGDAPVEEMRGLRRLLYRLSRRRRHRLLSLFFPLLLVGGFLLDVGLGVPLQTRVEVSTGWKGAIFVEFDFH